MPVIASPAILNPLPPDPQVFARLAASAAPNLIAAPGPAPRAYSIPGIQPPAGAQPDAPLRSPGIASPAMPPAALMPAGAPSAPAPKIASPATPPSPMSLAIQQAKDAENAIKPPSYTGKLGVLEKIGDVAGRLLAPGIEQRLGVGTIGYQQRLAQAEGQTDRLEKQAGTEATTAKAGADAQLETANADKAAQGPPPSFDIQNTSHGLVRINKATGEVAPVTLNGQPLTAPMTGQPHVQATDSGLVLIGQDGAVTPLTGPDGKPLMPAPTAAGTAGKLITGTVNGKPAYAEFDPGKGFVDPQTRHPMTGFVPPDANDKLSGMGAYTLSRILQEETSDNPAIRVLIPALLDKLGIQLSPEQRAAIEAVPAGQPTNDAGRVIGTRMPEAPTSTSRTRGQQADALLQQLPSLEQQIRQLDVAGKLGPVAGRWNDFLVGKVGANDPDVAAFRSNLNAFISGLSKAHLNTEGGVRDFESAIGGPHSTAQNLLAALTPMKDLLGKYRNIGAGTPEGAAGGEIERLGSDGKTYVLSPDKKSWAVKK